MSAASSSSSSPRSSSPYSYAIVGVFIVAAIFTPPDPISQLSLAFPIILLYEISILMAKMVEKKRAEAQGEGESKAGVETARPTRKFART